jgi:hypothetical protein
LWKWFWFFIFSHNRNNCIYPINKKDSLNHWLLKCPSIDQILGLDERIVPQPLPFICAHKLYIRIVALRCNLAMIVKMCICFFTLKYGQQVMYENNWKLTRLPMRLICKQIYQPCVRWYSFGYRGHM